MSHAFSVGKLQCWKTSVLENGFGRDRFGVDPPWHPPLFVTRVEWPIRVPVFGLSSVTTAAGTDGEGPINSVTRAVVLGLRSRDATRTADENSRLP